METDGLAEMMARILVFVSLRSFTPVVHPCVNIPNIVISRESHLETSTGHFEFRFRDACECALIVHQLDASSPGLKIFPVVHNFFREGYTCTPFRSVEERRDYAPTSLGYIEKTYADVNVPGTLSIGGLALILELFCLCEKQNQDAHQFKYSLVWTKECIECKKNYRNLLNLAINHREY